MKPYISLITLGVKDLQKSFEFYQSLGFPTQGIEDDVVFFPLKNIHLSLFPLEKLAKESGVSLTPGTPAITLAHNVSSIDEVNALFTEVEKVGGVITAPPAPTHWGGYSGYFQDPDGYVWEVAFNPFSPDMIKL